jgi:hypothetical protein
MCQIAGGTEITEIIAILALQKCIKGLKIFISSRAKGAFFSLPFPFRRDFIGKMGRKGNAIRKTSENGRHGKKVVTVSRVNRQRDKPGGLI